MEGVTTEIGLFISIKKGDGSYGLVPERYFCSYCCSL